MSIRMKIEMFYNIECNNKFNMLLLGSLQYIKKSFENQYMCCVSVVPSSFLLLLFFVGCVVCLFLET